MTEPGENDGLDPAFVKLALILLTGAMAVMFDTTIVNVAIDTLSRELNAPVSTTQWVISAYVLALAMVIPVSAWAMDRFGAKQTWMAALALFMIGSILSSIAWNIAVLIAFRTLQGIGGGLMLPVLQTLLVNAAGKRNLGRMMSLVSLPALLGPILGPVLGGLILSQLSWHWMFWVNVPFCVAGLLMAWRGLAPTAPRKGSYLDVLGLALLSPGLVAMIYGLSQAGSHGGFDHSAVLLPVTVGAVLLAGFAFHALRTRRPPLLDLRLFALRSFPASNVLLFLSGLSVYGAMLLLPLYEQQVRGQSALVAGLLLAPQGLGMLLTRGYAGRLTDRIGARPVVLGGFLLSIAGTLAYTQAGLDTNELLLGASLVIRGAGLGMVTIPIMAAAYLGLRSDQVPHASIATRITSQLGGAFGAAVLALILQTQIAAHASGGLAGLASAFDTAFWWSVGFTALAIIPTLFLPGSRELAPNPPDDGALTPSAGEHARGRAV
ncbi:MAG: MDR family MFS transporter [Candidatus Limnocylindrales bacterium]